MVLCVPVFLASRAYSVIKVFRMIPLKKKRGGGACVNTIRNEGLFRTYCRYSNLMS